MEKFIILTNNPLAAEKYAPDYEVEYREETALQVLLRARDRIHKGHRLLTHPLYGSVKPNETLYRSIMISRKTAATDNESLALIEDSILTWKKFGEIRRAWREQELKDFMLVDETLLRSGIESAIS